MSKAGKRYIPILGFRTDKAWKKLIASVYYGIVLIFLLMSIIMHDGTPVSKAMIVFFSIFLIIPIAIGIIKKPKRKSLSILVEENHEDVIAEKFESVEAPKEIAEVDRTLKNLTVHPDLEGLIWFADGDMKNCPDSLEFEPSAIQTALPITVPESINDVSPLVYYPSYSGMSDFQRGVYIQFLCNPYQPTDIGYVFVLYYGLERHLLSANYKRAFNVILKLRDVHKNQSFHSYSTTALIYAAILHDRKDLLKIFLQSIDAEHEKLVSFDLFVLTKKAFSMGISSEELMKYSSSFGFTNKRYMVANYSLFLSHLSNVLVEKYGINAFPTESVQTNELPAKEVRAFANASLKNTLSIPDVSYAHQFIEEGAALLQEAHNRVKDELHGSKR